MKATKYSTTIVIETLSLDTTIGLIFEVQEKLKDYREFVKTADDGDYMFFETKKEDIEF